MTFDEDDFNASGGVESDDFALSGSRGDDVWLMEGDASFRLGRFVDDVHFEAAANGESFGRMSNSAGVPYFYPTQTPSLSGPNSDPRVGPLLISEIMYHPPDPDGTGGVDPDDLEFIEVYNPTGQPVALTHWQLAGGVDMRFDDGLILAPHGVLVVLRFDPAKPENESRVHDFRAAYGIPREVTLTGGYSGKLDNGGELLRLMRPDEPPGDEPDFIPLLIEDEAEYDDQLPWPMEPDAGGSSLTRMLPAGWGDEPNNWLAANPSPGSVPQSGIVGRYVLYNHSAFDGQDPAVNSADDGAVAFDKTPLFAGQAAAFANYTSYVHGLNGIVIDINGAPQAANLSEIDFELRVGNSDDPSAWDAAPVPSEVTVRLAAGVGGSDRVTLVWPNGTIAGMWLEVVVLVNERTGLSAPDVFYFGNAPGETGDSISHALVNAFDFAGPRDTTSLAAAVDDRFDFNRDGLTDGTDLAIARDHTTDFRTTLRLIRSPAAAPPVADIVRADSIAVNRTLNDAAVERSLQKAREAAVLAIVPAAALAVDDGDALRRFAERHTDEDTLDALTFELHSKLRVAATSATLRKSDTFSV